MMYRRMGPKDYEELIRQNIQFEEAKRILKEANIPGPYRMIQSPDVDRP